MDLEEEKLNPNIKIIIIGTLTILTVIASYNFFPNKAVLVITVAAILLVFSIVEEMNEKIDEIVNNYLQAKNETKKHLKQTDR